MKNPKKSNKVGIIVNLVLLFAFTATILCFFANIYMSPKIIPTYDENISPKVNTYLESVMPKSNFAGVHIDHHNTYCYNFIYGYSEEYVYAHATCRQYAWRYYEKPQYDENGRYLIEPVPPIEIIREFYNTGNGMSSYLRLSYEPGTDFEFTGYEYPEPGSGYYKSTTEMFQMKNIGPPPQEESARALEELEARFHAENDDALMPTRL